MLDIDFTAHNERSREIWTAYNAGNPFRVPVDIYADVRNWLREKSQNPRGLTMGDYLRDMDLMFDCQVLAQEWIRMNILSDKGAGYPEDGWSLRVDFQNFLESAWFGAPVSWGEEPHTTPFITDDARRMLFDRGMPAPAVGICADVIRCYEHFVAKARGYSYKGIGIREVLMPFNMLGTDGPFTVACGIRGAEQLIGDMMNDPDYAHELLLFVTRATIDRIRFARRYLGVPEVSDGFGFADDAIVLLSPAMFREFVLPLHGLIFEALSPGPGGRSMHLCGDAQRFFPILERELAVKSFDTGFPIDFSRLYVELSSDVQILGGPSVALLLTGTPAEIKREVKRVLQSGVMEKSRRFILREGNSLAPGTPMDNVNAIYGACEEFGYYDQGRRI